MKVERLGKDRTLSSPEELTLNSITGKQKFLIFLGGCTEVGKPHSREQGVPREEPKVDGVHRGAVTRAGLQERSACMCTIS